MATVHLFNPLVNFAGGSEQRTVELFRILDEVAEVNIWTNREPHPKFYGQYPIRRLAPPASFPTSGVFVFVGAFFPVGDWMSHAKPKRVVVVHNTDEPHHLRNLASHFAAIDYPPIEVLYATSQLFDRTPEFPGIVQESPIDLDRFTPAESRNGHFTIGRMSRADRLKHHPEDIEIYRQLAATGVRVRIMGGTGLDTEGNIEVIPSDSIPAPAFLQSLDCFYYRTHPSWFETYGRVVFEAMACGLPVVAEARHGYAEQLTSGRDCVLVRDAEEAMSAIMEIRANPEWARQLGRAARARVEAMYGPDFRKRIQAFYTFQE